MKALSRDEVRARYESAASLEKDFLKGRWGSYESMMNRYAVALQFIDFASVERWLDLGAGAGVFQSLVAKRTRISTIVALDLVPCLLKFLAEKACTQRFKADLVQGDVACLPFAGGGFDLITAIGVIGSCGANFKVVVAEIARCLKPAGQCFISVMHADWRGFGIPGNSKDTEHDWFRVPELEEALVGNQVQPLFVKGLMPRTGRLGLPEEGYCLVVGGKKLQPQ